MSRVYIVVMTLFVLCMAVPSLSDDEFEPVTGQEQTQMSPGGQSHDTSGLSAIIAKSGIRDAAVVINIILLCIGIIVFFSGKFNLRYLLVLSSVSFLGFYVGGCSCAVGASVKVFYNAFSGGNVYFAALVLGIPLISTIITGRIFCGYVCPIGAVQEFLQIKSNPVKIPYRIEKKAGWIRFAVLISLVVFSVVLSHYILDSIDPFKAVFQQKGNIPQWVAAACILTASIYISRPFCRFICPLAALLKLAGKVSLYKMRQTSGSCINCSLCGKVCPVNAIDDKYVIDNSECIRCGRCVEVCSQNRKGR